MQKEIKKVISLSVLVLGVVFLAGCGNGQTGTNTNVPNGIESSADTVKDNATPVAPTSADTSNLSTPPTPTGKVDDTVNAIVDGAKNESTQVTSDENDAKAATDNSTNSQAANDLGAGL